MDLGLSDRVAVITGGSRGIGRAVASRIADEGADLALVGRTEETLQDAAREIAAASGRRVMALRADTADSGAVAAMGHGVVEEYGRVDILVNCAARSAAQIPSTTWDTLDETVMWPELNTKLLGYLRCAQAVAPAMIQQGWGRIVNVGGMTALRTGNVVATVRNISIAALTKSLADELGPSGISVNGVHPDMTRTERTPRMLAARAEAAGTSIDEITARLAKRNTVGRIIDSSEVADVVAFLVSPRAIAINGETLAVGGGQPGAIRY